MKALLAFLAGVACALAFRDHRPGRVPFGWRCRFCGKPAATEGELMGLDVELRERIQ